MSWWWWGPGGSPPDPAALLAEAVVRFDFSQYDDVDNMVDLNGGWGPFTPNIHATTEFTAQGLRLIDAQPGLQQQVFIEGVESPIEFNEQGLTILAVNLAGVPPSADFNVGIQDIDMPALGLSAYAPDVGGKLIASVAPNPAIYWTYLVDVEPGGEMIVGGFEDRSLGFESTEAGLFIYVAAHDLIAEETRIRAVTPGGDFAETLPFNVTPAYPAAHRSADSLYYSACGGIDAAPDDQTYVEFLVWNRALSPAEVDVLVAYFTA